MSNPIVDIKELGSKYWAAMKEIEPEKEPKSRRSCFRDLVFPELCPQHNFSDRITEDNFDVSQVRILQWTNPPMQGKDVSALQNALVKDGFAIVVDGCYEEETEMAVRQFQARTGLVIDGIFGTATYQQLFG